MVNTMGWNERSDPDMRTANFCDVYREGVNCDNDINYDISRNRMHTRIFLRKIGSCKNAHVMY